MRCYTSHSVGVCIYFTLFSSAVFSVIIAVIDMPSSTLEMLKKCGWSAADINETTVILCSYNCSNKKISRPNTCNGSNHYFNNMI